MPQAELNDQPARPAISRRQLGLPVAKLLCGGLLLGYLGSQVEVSALLRQVTQAKAAPLVASVGVYGCGVLLHAWRWRVLLTQRGIAVRLSRLVQLLLGAGFLNLFLPGNLSGDVYRVFAGRSASATLVDTAGVVIVERYFGFLATFCLALGGLAAGDFARRAPAATAIILALLGLFLIPLLLAAIPRQPAVLTPHIGGLGATWGWTAATRVCAELRAFLGSPREVAKVLVLSLAMKVCVTLILHLLVVSLGLDVGLDQLLVFLPLHSVVSALPISINGVGPREANMVAFLAHCGVPTQAAAGLALLHLAWVYAIGLPGGVCLLAFSPPARRDAETSIR